MEHARPKKDIRKQSWSIDLLKKLAKTANKM
jgi:hypothetical protein